MAYSQVPDNKNSERNNDTQVPEWILASNGIKLLINNRNAEAEELFLQYPDSLVMFAGYSFTIFMDALMSFEEDKLNLAISTLKEVEKRCSLENGWFKSISNKMFNTGLESPVKSLENQLETQIIYADSQVCIAILTFLQQDISGYFKGGWVLRKAWKVYQKTYKDILQLYKDNIGELFLPDPCQLAASSSPTQEWDIPDTNGYTKFPHSQSHHHLNGTIINKTNTNAVNSDGFIKKSISMNCALSANETNSKLAGIWPTKLNPFNHFPYLTNTLHFFNTQQDKSNCKDVDIKKETIVRLMGAISFGYGLFQLGISLLPPSIMKLINLLGFNANRQNGIACLMYARQGVDMRAPLATLSLLWYHTIVRPFYAIDGSNVQAGVDVSMQLYNESEREFQQSALFLFFKGRIYRLKSDISSALKAFQQSVANSQQREMRILAMHEVAWCHLIELDYKLAENNLINLRSLSRWSRPFYTYLATICIGCTNINERTTDYEIFNELKTCIENGLRSGPLDEFLMKRYKKLPYNNVTKDEIDKIPSIYFKLLLYEMLYLWNALPSCSYTNIDKIIEECESVNNSINEPMIGLSNLIAASCYIIRSNNQLAIEHLRKSLEKRKHLPNNADDAHVTAFSQCELADLLIRTPETKEEGKLLLQQMNRYGHYDFDSRLNVRVHSLLKHL